MKKKILALSFVIVVASMGLAREGTPYKGAENLDAIESIILSEAPLSQVLFIMEELTGKPILKDGKLEDIVIDLQIRNPVDKADAIRAIESVLALNNIAIVELGGGLLKAVDARNASSQSPRFMEQSLLGLEPSEKICSKLFQLKYLQVGEFSKISDGLLNPISASKIAFEDSNSILITDSISNLQRVELILEKVDIPRHSVIDSKIFRIKHGDAREIAELLNKVIKGQQSKNIKEGSVPSPDIINSLTLSHSFQFSKSLTIEHDSRSNSIVICGTPTDIEHVGTIIDQIDVLLDQVRIEVVIAQVTLSKGQATGLDSFGIDYNIKDKSGSGPVVIGGHDFHVSTAGNAGANLTSIFTLSGNLKNFSLGTIFQRAKSDSDVKVLSAPTIVTSHNREAIVKIVESMPVVKSDISDTSSSGGSTSSTAVKSTVEYKDIGIELKVKPLIGVNGVVQMEINQRVESRGDSVKINGNELPTTTKREATSFVSACDGDTVVLAGLQEKTSSSSKGKLWLFGDLPIVGPLLFSPKSKLDKTTELIIFIKPTIVSNPSGEGAFAGKFLRGSVLKEEIDNYNATGRFLHEQLPHGTLSDPTIDYSKRKIVDCRPGRWRTRGPASNSCSVANDKGKAENANVDDIELEPIDTPIKHEKISNSEEKLNGNLATSGYDYKKRKIGNRRLVRRSVSKPTSNLRQVVIDDAEEKAANIDKKEIDPTEVPAAQEEVNNRSQVSDADPSYLRNKSNKKIKKPSGSERKMFAIREAKAIETDDMSEQKSDTKRVVRSHKRQRHGHKAF